MLFIYLNKNNQKQKENVTYIMITTKKMFLIKYRPIKNVLKVYNMRVSIKMRENSLKYWSHSFPIKYNIKYIY